ncbi:hypothetical protein SODALDRAFT_332958 [Sodiomyces alkalinus F11]|uniref:Uncharacterized protein n=1 Tax=Sodiomyces alkalinus (strain CBS 110278 / VKM F-3762 / F11) TaxID=1314773 RepID=A0A3N2PV82_SODAK|nr:hypothetical protein SODALDRAFT_332958 [Sodiomyces alkalinus F11]ROT38388.1 hypothetical protein SODALDRAFT_332958 [Sodiomyces alkalinus F11]
MGYGWLTDKRRLGNTGWLGSGLITCFFFCYSAPAISHGSTASLELTSRRLTKLKRLVSWLAYFAKLDSLDRRREMYSAK